MKMNRRALRQDRKDELFLTLFFAAFLFLWVTVLGLGSHAGEGLLTARQMELTYYAQQVFLIAGFLLYAAFSGRPRKDRFYRCCTLITAAAFFAGAVLMLAADRGTVFYLVIDLAMMLCLGGLGGAVYHRMSLETAKGAASARCMGVGSALATALQYVLQLRWGQSALLPVFMLAAFLLLTYRLLICPAGTLPDAEEQAAGRAGVSRLLTVCLITALFLLFIDFYNEYIVHLQIQSGSTYTYYSWPRLMMIPCYLLFALIGDKKQGRLVPIAALCIVLAATLNPVLTGSNGAYWVNMCLFYCALAATISYFTLSFWRLAPGTGHPAFWAPMGRVLDSALVLFTGAVHIDQAPPAAMLGLDIAGIALIILMMAAGGSFNLAASAADESPAAAGIARDCGEAPVTRNVSPLLSPEEALEQMRKEYGLTPREAEVLRELVLTEDKQTVISERLSIRVKTLQDHITRLYRKTGASTRVGLTDLYHGSRNRT